MSIDIRLPNINADTESGQLGQVKSYLYQLAEQLRWALNTLETGNAGVVVSEAYSKGGADKNDPASPGSTFNSIKSLIIKSSEIVDAYYEDISKRIDGLYVSDSEFGTYSEQTSHTISENSTAIKQMFSNIQQINSDLQEIENTLIDVNAYIKSGLLGYDDAGAPIYGLEIGQRNTIDGVEVFNKYSRFTSGRLSFYDMNDTEVAYISDYKLYITNAEITGTLTLGKFILETSDGIVCRWLGGG